MLARTNSVIEKVNGRTPIGNTIKEFEIKPTGGGGVTATITVKPPNGNAMKTVYQFTVE